MRAAPLHGAVGEQRIVAGDDEVAGRGDHHAAHDAVALDLRDGGLGQVAPAHGVLEEALPEAPILALEPGLERRLLLVLHLLRAAEIVAGREMLAGAGQDDDAHLVVVDGAVNASSSSSSRMRLWAFSTSGRLVVILSTAPVRSVSRVV